MTDRPASIDLSGTEEMHNELAARVPGHTLESLWRWIEHGLPPGSFVQAVLENNLREACARADLQNRAALFDIVAYCYWRLPGNCWGSPEAAKAWGEKRAHERVTEGARE